MNKMTRIEKSIMDRLAKCIDDKDMVAGDGAGTVRRRGIIKHIDWIERSFTVQMCKVVRTDSHVGYRFIKELKGEF